MEFCEEFYWEGMDRLKLKMKKYLACYSFQKKGSVKVMKKKGMAGTETEHCQLCLSLLGRRLSREERRAVCPCGSWALSLIAKSSECCQRTEAQQVSGLGGASALSSAVFAPIKTRLFCERCHIFEIRTCLL